MEYLADLRDLIMGRAEQATHIHSSINALLASNSPPTSMQSEVQLNRAVIKLIAAIKRKEKERVEVEGDLLEEIKDLRFLATRTIEEVTIDEKQVHQAALSIFVLFDLTVVVNEEKGLSASDRLRRLFMRFFQKHHLKTQSKEILRMMSHHITQSTPFILMGWISEWSRQHFIEEVQTATNNQFSRHEDAMKKMDNRRSPCREKMSPFCHSSILPRYEPSTPPTLTNKQSVYGLFLEELTQYYKAMPVDLELDYGFLKSMKNLRPKGREFESEDTLQKAAEILIEAKNKHTRDQITQFTTESQLYLQKNSKPQQKLQQKNSQTKSKADLQCKEKSPHKKHSPIKKFFQRVKSQSNEESVEAVSPQKRNSLLLCPKAKEINFQASREIMRKLHRQKVQKQFQLPQIAPNRILSTCAPANKNKQRNPFYEPNSSMISHYQRYERSAKAPVSVLPPKSIQFKQPLSKEQQHQFQRKVRMEMENPESGRLEGQELHRNRKMMLQLLREKNRHAFLDR